MATDSTPISSTLSISAVLSDPAVVPLPTTATNQSHSNHLVHNRLANCRDIRCVDVLNLNSKRVTQTDCAWDADEEDSTCTVGNSSSDQMEDREESDNSHVNEHKTATAVDDVTVLANPTNRTETDHTTTAEHVEHGNNSHQNGNHTADDEVSVQYESCGSADTNGGILDSNVDVDPGHYTPLAQPIPSDYYASSTPINDANPSNVVQLSSPSSSPVIGRTVCDPLSEGDNSTPNDENALNEAEISMVMKHGVWTQIDRTNPHIEEFLSSMDDDCELSL